MVAYKVDDFYAPASDSGLIWNDPTLAIDWPVRPDEAVLSDKDLKLGRFAEFRVTIQVRRLMSKRILVTGGAGFIGSAVVRHIIRETDHRVLVVDKLTYAGNLDSLAPVSSDPRYVVRARGYRRCAEDARGCSTTFSRTPSCILPPKAMSIARSTGPATSSRPT